MKRLCARHSTVRTSDSGSTAQPSRQPVIEKYFEKLLMTIASSSKASAVTGAWP